HRVRTRFGKGARYLGRFLPPRLLPPPFFGSGLGDGEGSPHSLRETRSIVRWFSSSNHRCWASVITSGSPAMVTFIRWRSALVVRAQWGASPRFWFETPCRRMVTWHLYEGSTGHVFCTWFTHATWRLAEPCPVYRAAGVRRRRASRRWRSGRTGGLN